MSISQKTFFAVAFLAVAGAAGMSGSAQAATQEDRYCLARDITGTFGECFYATLEQCQAAASGQQAYCKLNPYYAFADEPQQAPVKHKRKHRTVN